MTTVLFKYQSSVGDYLVCDLEKSHLVLDERAVRKICSRNFGIGSKGVVAGHAGGRDMRVYRPDGTPETADKAALDVFTSYLADAGYRDQAASGARPAFMGKVFLTDDFAARNELGTI